MAEAPKGIIRVRPRYTMECESCGWRSYPYIEEDAAIGEWREHVRAHLNAPVLPPCDLHNDSVCPWCGDDLPAQYDGSPGGGV